MKLGVAAKVSLVAMSLALAACGGGGTTSTPPPVTGGGGGSGGGSGGGGGGGTPTPTPPPATLDGLNQSVSFQSLGQTASGTFPVDGSQPSFAARQSQATLDFDAAAGSWTISVDGRSQTFLASDFDSTQSSDSLTTFTRIDGDTTDFLTITRKGPNGDFTFQYVGSVFWQRTIDGAVNIEGSFDALVFGLPTGDSAIPTGSAFYDIDIFGALGQGGGIANYTGEGELVVDFASGGIFFDAFVSGTTGPGVIQGNALLTSGSNGFTGTVSALFAETWAGPVEGQFFGPNAEEVGASFQGVNSRDGSVTVGTIMGSNSGSGGGNTDFGSLSSSQVFTGEARTVEFDADSTTAPATNITLGEADFRVAYTLQQGGLYAFFRPQGAVAKFAPDDFGLDPSGYIGMRLSDTSQGWLQYQFLDYVSVGRWVFNEGDRYRFDEFIFGFDTDPAALPTGEAGYRLNLGGTALLDGEVPVAIGGQGTLAVDFASGLLTGSGAIGGFDGSGLFGTWNGSATITSGTSDFAGDWGVTGEGGAPDFTGNWSGGFFGPVADEVAATFSATASDGSVLVGVLAGDRDDTAIAGGTPLSEITEETSFDNSPTATQEQRNADPDDYSYSTGRNIVTYDPATGNYSFAKDPGAGNFGYDGMAIDFAGTDRVDAESDDSFVVYRNADGEMQLLNFESVNPVIDLTYVSFAKVFQTRQDFSGNDLTNRYWTVFGDRTLIDNMPRSGSANYSGIATGAGFVQNYSDNADIDGSFTMAVNFGSNETSGNFAFTAIDPNGALADLNIGSYDFDGFVSNNQFFGSQPGFDHRLNIQGWFFGPATEEVGGSWKLDRDNSLDLPGLEITGVFVGKRDED